MTFDERLWVPWWWWPVAAVVVALLGAEVHVGLGWTVAVVTYAVLGTFAAVLLLRWGGARIVVTGEALAAAGRRLRLDRVSDVRVLAREDARPVLANRPARADVVLVRGYTSRVVYVAGHDDRDEPAFWLLSTRRPKELVAAIGVVPAAPEAGDGSR